MKIFNLVLCFFLASCITPNTEEVVVQDPPKVSKSETFNRPLTYDSIQLTDVEKVLFKGGRSSVLGEMMGWGSRDKVKVFDPSMFDGFPFSEYHEKDIENVNKIREYLFNLERKKQ